MLETITFPMAACNLCGRDVLLTQQLDENDQLVLACIHCDFPTAPDAQLRYVGPALLKGLGYEVEGEFDKRGCGSGSEEDEACTACATTSCTVH
jgi:hypothetical protein